MLQRCRKLKAACVIRKNVNSCWKRSLNWQAANGGFVPSAVKSAPRRRRGADGSDFGALSESKRVFHVNPEIAHRIFDLAMPEKDLHGTEVAGRPVDDRCLRPPK